MLERGKAVGSSLRGLRALGRGEFDLQGEYSRLVTFLNQTLKSRDLIFGITRTSNGRLCLTIYEPDSGRERQQWKKDTHQGCISQ